MRRMGCAAALLGILFLAGAPASAGTITQLLFTQGGAFSSSNTFKTALINFIAGAQVSVDVAIYNLRDADVITALNTAFTGGKTVRIMTDGDNVPISGLDPGITVVTDGANSNEMHHKFIVIDPGTSNAGVWTGSANFVSPGFSSQNNNAITIFDQNVAAAFLLEFNRLYVSGGSHQTKTLSNTTFVLDDGTSVEIRFSPGMSVQNNLASLVSGATSSFYSAIFTYNSSTISDAMIGNSGRTNFTLFEGSQASSPAFTKLDELQAAGLSVAVDVNPFEMHHKFMVVDARTVATGSYNFTSAGDVLNDENSVVIRNNVGIAQRYIREINRIASQDLNGLGAGVASDTSAPLADGSTPSSPSSSSSTTGTGAAQVLTGPNPFRLGTDVLNFMTSNAGAITKVEIYDLSGRLVHSIVPTSSAATIPWDGRNQRSERVAPGMYLYRVTAGEKFYSGRFTAVP